MITVIFLCAATLLAFGILEAEDNPNEPDNPKATILFLLGLFIGGLGLFLSQ